MKLDAAAIAKEKEIEFFKHLDELQPIQQVIDWSIVASQQTSQFLLQVDRKGIQSICSFNKSV